MTNVFPNYPSVTPPLYSARSKATKSPIFQGSIGSSYAYGQTLRNFALRFGRSFCPCSFDTHSCINIKVASDR